GGYSYWVLNDYRLHPENGVLPQRWMALPLLLSGAVFPSLDQYYWLTSDGWVMAHEFFYETKWDHFPWLMAARAMTALLSAGIGLLIFCWSRRLFGTAGAFVSLIFFTFSPTFLAHGGLATSDVCMGFFMLASLGAWWRHLNTPGAWPFAVSACVFGLACVAKFSAPMIPPMMLLCAVVHVAAQRGRIGRVLLSALGHGAVAFVIIWAFYGFRYSAFGPGLPAERFIESWQELYSRTGRIGQVIHALANVHALPEAFLYGTAYVAETSQLRGAFLNGQYSIVGWWYFFPWAFALKTTIPFLIASVLALVFAALGRPGAAPASRRDALLALTPLLALFAVYWAFSLRIHLNIGERHLIPTYPVLFILSGALGAWLARPLGAGACVVIGLLAWHAAESVAIFPHYLAYFNELGGGPSEGYRHLVDSSLDWGQDLPGLKAWLDRNRLPGEDAYLAYFGSGEPAYYKLKVKRLGHLNGFHEDETYVPMGAGLYCVSATVLQHVYSSIQGPWTPELEKEYQFLRTFEPMFLRFEAGSAARAQLEVGLPEEKWVASRNRFEHLRLARLCYCLRARRPDAMIGYSILVYRLSAEDVRAATGGSIRDWTALIVRSAEGTAGR
ncbi:MAG TPA: glycosyltransferase family 39 protein, partial [Opitutaceae bacterium]